MENLQKNQIIGNVEVTGIEFQGKGIARREGKVIFVEGALPGEIVDVKITRNKKDYAVGQAVVTHRYSADREQPVCTHFGFCGGCKWQNLSYPKQLQYKEIFLRETLNRIAQLTDVPLLPIIGCPEPFYYRNKLEFAFSDQRWLTQPERDSTDSAVNRNALGFHMAGRFDRVLHITKCYLQPEPSNAIRNFVFRYASEKGLQFFNIKKKQGLLRNLIIRITTTGEVMVILGFFYDAEKEIIAIMNALKEAFPSITSLNYAIINGASDVIYPYEIVCYYGNPYITEKLGHLQLKIGPKSFFQTNSRQAKVLYDVVLDFAALKGIETVYDLYAGIGSISLYVAQRSRKVLGIEQIPEAVADAEKNALHNKISNCEFFAGDVREVLQRDFFNQHGKPDLVITDPPRAGMHTDVIDRLLEMKVPKIIYVSCNPVTQARDLQLLSDVYHVEKVQPVDMFPQTYHIESVALLHLKAC